MPKSLSRSIAVLAALLAAAMATLTFGLIFGGGAAPLALADPGPFIRVGLPVARGIQEITMAIAIGSLVFTAFALPNRDKLLERTLNVASAFSALWAISGLGYLVFTYMFVADIGFGPNFAAGFTQFVLGVQLGQLLAMNAAAAAVLTLLTLGVRGLTGAGMLAAFAIASLIPLAQTGHAAGTAGHGMAVNSIGIHIVAVSIWVGGLAALFIIRGASGTQAATLARRYSSLALVAFFLVAVSGAFATVLRIKSFDQWFTPYGGLVALKISGLLILGAFGASYRLRVLRRLDAQPGNAPRFWNLIVVELLVMGGTIGIATALSQTAPPGATAPLPVGGLAPLTPAQILTGEMLPPPLTGDSYFFAWKIDLLWLLIAIAASVAYVAGVIRLRRRGDSWHWSRTASWLGGMALLVYTTSGVFNVYEEYLFSTHMLAHMVLAMGIPVLLVPGAPVTLLARAVAKRKDDSMGVREWVLWAVHTPFARIVSNPIVAGVLFASSLVTFYFTGLFSWATHEHIGHEWMVLHFLITGYLFVQALVGIDPGPNRLPFAARLLLLIGTLTFHAFFGLALMDGHALLLADWYGAMGRTWGATPLADQATGGAIAWGIGEVPTAVLTIIVASQWFRADQRDSRRLDRASDRSGNQDVSDYNAMLAALAAREERARGRQAGPTGVPQTGDQRED